MQRRIENRTEMLAFAGQMIGSLVPRERATVLALSGDLGAGKTTFTQGAALTLGVQESVQSPTFVIEKIYALEGQKFARLIHIDAYRLKSGHELRVLGFEELLRDGRDLIILEWPEKVADAMPGDAVRIRFDIDGDGRIITVNDGKESGEKSSS